MQCTQLEKQIDRLKQEQNEEQDILEEERAEMERERDQVLKEKKSLLDRLAALEKEKEELELSRDSLEKEKDLGKDSSAESKSGGLCALSSVQVGNAHYMGLRYFTQYHHLHFTKYFLDSNNNNNNR